MSASVFYFHGGGTDKDTKDNKYLFTELPELSNVQSVLAIYFARPEVEWDNLAARDHLRICGAKDQIRFEIANPDPAILVHQLATAELIFIRGGDTEILMSMLNRQHSLEVLTQDKIIIGSSAGAYVLSKYYWSNSTKSIKNGLGIANVKLFCHYETSQEPNALLLESYDDTAGYPTLRIASGHFTKYVEGVKH